MINFFAPEIFRCLSIFQHSVQLHQPILEYLAAGGPSVTVFPRCPNKETATDVSDSCRDNGCYRYSKTDAHPDRCQWGHLQALGSGAADRCVIIITIPLLLIRASLIPGTHPPVSLIPLSFHSTCNCRWSIILRYEMSTMWLVVFGISLQKLNICEEQQVRDWARKVIKLDKNPWCIKGKE